jgi:hypothetical protein
MDEKQIRFELRLTPEIWAEVDEWRRRQPDRPNRTKAVRRLLEFALRAERKPASKPRKAGGE